MRAAGERASRYLRTRRFRKPDCEDLTLEGLAHSRLASSPVQDTHSGLLEHAQAQAQECSACAPGGEPGGGRAPREECACAPRSGASAGRVRMRPQRGPGPARPAPHQGQDTGLICQVSKSRWTHTPPPHGGPGGGWLRDGSPEGAVGPHSPTPGKTQPRRSRFTGCLYQHDPWQVHVCWGHRQRRMPGWRALLLQKAQRQMLGQKREPRVPAATATLPPPSLLPTSDRQLEPVGTAP